MLYMCLVIKYFQNLTNLKTKIKTNACCYQIIYIHFVLVT